MPTPTYTPLANITLTSATIAISFTSISQSYRDLILVGSGTFNDNAIPQFAYGSSYQGVRAYAYSSSVYSDNMPETSKFWTPMGTSRNNFQFKLEMFDYTQTDKHKTAVCTSGNDISNGMAVFRSGTTSAITSITIRNNGDWNFQIGSTFALYGIAA